MQEGRDSYAGCHFAHSKRAREIATDAKHAIAIHRICAGMNKRYIYSLYT